MSPHDSDLLALPEELRSLYDALPAWVTRKEAAKASGYAVAAGSLANADCVGQGPATRIRCGRQVLYPRKDFVLWLAGRVTIERQG